MLKSVAIFFVVVVIFSVSLVKGKSGTICREYSDISDAGTCSGQTIYVQSEPGSNPPQDCVKKSTLEETVKTNVQASYFTMKEKLNKLNNTIIKMIDESLKTKPANLCNPNPCDNNGICISGIEDFACNCPVGYEGNNCSRKNLCFPNPCQNNGTCTSGNMIYQCKCPPGYRGINCETRSCSDGLLVGNTRIFIPHSHNTINANTQLATAKQHCESLNATFAEILSSSMFKEVITYVRSAWQNPKLFSKTFWLGSSFEPVDNPCNLVTITNGMRVSLNGSWLNGYPFLGQKYSSAKSMLMTIRSNGDFGNGVWNYVGSNARGIALCACNAYA